MRVAIVNDTATATEALRRVLALAPEHRIAWTAVDGTEAVERCAADRPDLILMDLVMPGMDGVEATRRIMASCPCAILIVTANVDDQVSRTFAAMGHGALDAVDLPRLGRGDLHAEAKPLLTKLTALARLIGANGEPSAGLRPGPDRGVTLVAVGASAGGPAALATMLAALPHDFGGAVVIVQHIDERFAPGMAAWLGLHSTLPVRLAQDGDGPVAHEVLLAGRGDHLVFIAPGRLGYSARPLDAIYRPSINALFESTCERWAGPAVGVLLTGMGADGARGLKALRARGHHTIAQDHETSAVYGMPKAAAAIAAAVEILPLERIAPRLVELVAAPGAIRRPVA